MRKHIKIDISKPLTGAFDFSHLLDAPAGVHGQTVVKDGSLYFEDGTRARFVGFNIPSGGMMPNHETAEVYAKRLASMGYNVVRLHAEDSVWNRDGISTIDYKNGGCPKATAADFRPGGRGTPTPTQRRRRLPPDSPKLRKPPEDAARGASSPGRRAPSSPLASNLCSGRPRPRSPPAQPHSPPGRPSARHPGRRAQGLMLSAEED